SPVLVIGGVRWSGDIERETVRRRETMLLVAGQSATKAENILTAAPSLLNVIDTLIGPDACAGGKLDQAVDLLPQYTAMGVINSDGLVRCSTTEGAQGISVTDRDWYRELRDSGAGISQSAAIFGPLSKTWMMTSAKRRLNKDGSFGGAL